jgi:hypothetical protein
MYCANPLTYNSGCFISISLKTKKYPFRIAVLQVLFSKGLPILQHINIASKYYKKIYDCKIVPFDGD